MRRDYCQRYTPNEQSSFGGVKLAGLDRVSFDAVMLAAITSTDNNAQYTPPTPMRLNCRVESRRRRVGVGGVY